MKKFNFNSDIWLSGVSIGILMGIIITIIVLESLFVIPEKSEPKSNIVWKAKCSSNIIFEHQEPCNFVTYFPAEYDKNGLIKYPEGQFCPKCGRELLFYNGKTKEEADEGMHY